MQKHAVTIDFAKNMVTLKNKNNFVDIKLSSSDADLARVNHSTPIPANSRVDFIVKVSRNRSQGTFILTFKLTP